jgi:threonine dehydratase
MSSKSCLAVEVPWSSEPRYMEGDPPCKVPIDSRYSLMEKERQNVRKPSLSGVMDAAVAVSKIVPLTPLLTFEHSGRTIFAKAESLQPIGAFKLRGAWWRLSSLDKSDRAKGVVAYSSGNHAQGIAWAAARLGMTATIVMPSDAPEAKQARTKALGATVVLYDRHTEDRAAIAEALAAKTGAVVVPPFADPWVIEGQGSAGIEAIAQLADRGVGPPDLVVTCCGGGGLSAGMALACPDARIVIVEPEGWDDVTRSLAQGAIADAANAAPPTACDALQTPKPAPVTFDVLKSRGATGVTVSESEVETAMRFAYETFRLVLEPGGAVALAAILSGTVEPGERTVITLSGGNVDAAHFARVIAG